jgi:NAD(P)-dependent dehydrogenase (short-subunit alcohol dehydrogenase family)
MGRLQDKVAVITGANSGIGLAAAKLFAANGARVFMTGRRKKELDAAVSEVGKSARGIQCDISELPDLDCLFATVSDDAGVIDVLFANAGGGEFLPLGSITEEHFDKIFSTNVKGTLFTVHKALPLMKDGGSIILTGSTAATKGTPAFSVYSASKAAIRNFARSWIIELAPRKIRVNVLVPGATSTPGWHDLATSEEIHKGDDRLCENDDASRTSRRTRGERESYPLPCLGRQRLRQRQRAVCRWRLRSDLGHGAPVRASRMPPSPRCGGWTPACSAQPNGVGSLRPSH